MSSLAFHRLLLLRDTESHILENGKPAAKPNLEWATGRSGARFALFVHHDDGTREFAYDRADTLQKFSIGWDEALAKGWTVVSMQKDWNTLPLKN